jgi:hypothetical protein
MIVHLDDVLRLNVGVAHDIIDTPSAYQPIILILSKSILPQIMNIAPPAWRERALISVAVVCCMHFCLTPIE